MGIWEALKRAYVQVTGKSDGMYRIHSNRVGLPSDGDVFFDMAASSPQQTPPGVEWYVDTNGDMAWKWARNTSGIQPVYICTSTSQATDKGTALTAAADRTNLVNPLYSDTEGVAVTDITNYRWKQDTVAITNNTANTTLVAKNASFAIEIMVHSVDVIMIDDVNPIQPALAFQDEDDAACEGIDTVVCGTVYGDYTNGKLSGPAHWTFPWGIKAKTPAVNKDLEVDLTGIGAAVGHILRLNYSWRYVTA